MDRKHVATLMRRMGLEALYQKPKTTLRHPRHKIYLYLLRNLQITRPNQVWAMDVTYIPMAKGFVYLVAVVDWATRRVLAWHVSSITMDVQFCLNAVEEAIAYYGQPDIMNTDQGSQFTSHTFTEFKAQGIRISMDGRGAWRDNIFVERLWRSVKYKEVYLHAYDSVAAARAGLARYVQFCNNRRPHSSHGGKTPDHVYFHNQPQPKAASPKRERFTYRVSVTSLKNGPPVSATKCPRLFLREPVFGKPNIPTGQRMTAGHCNYFYPAQEPVR